MHLHPFHLPRVRLVSLLIVTSGWLACSQDHADDGHGEHGDDAAAGHVEQKNLEVHGDLIVHGKVLVVDEHGNSSVVADSHAQTHGENVQGPELQAQGAPTYEPLEWAYDGEKGPEKWGELAATTELCAKGQMQSPVDIDQAAPASLGSIDFAYQQVPLKISNDGHSVRIDLAAGGWLEFAAKRYDVVDVRFHSPSEHRVRGRSYDLVAHILHRSADGEILMLVVPYVIGNKHLVMDAIWKHFPTRVDEIAENKDILVSAESFLPGQRSYYTYIGSITHPPCTEGVRWVLLKTPTSVSSAQVARFQRSFPISTRPLQPLNGRSVGQGR